MKKSILIVSLLAIALLWLPQPVQAATPDRLIVGGNFTLDDGEILNEDLFIIGGLVSLEEGSKMNGTIIMLGGSLEVAGEVNGDIVVAGGLLALADSAVIHGDITAAGANLQRDPNATITGEIQTEQGGPFIVTPARVNLPQINTILAPSFSFIGFMLRVILWALLAMLLALFLPNQLENVSQTAINQPIISAGLGLLTVVVLPLVLVIIALTILLIPVSLLGILLLVIAWAFGLVALGTELGNRFAGIFKGQLHPALAAGAGTFLLILVINGVEAAIPCLGWLPKIIAGVLGLGAVLLTRFGMQLFSPSTSTPLPETVDEAE